MEIGFGDGNPRPSVASKVIGSTVRPLAPCSIPTGMN
jgi:hypothetical protein